MNITIQLPDEIAGVLSQSQSELARLTLEAMATAVYRKGLISRAQVGRLLGFESRFEVEEFLHRAGAALPYDEADLEHDRATLARLAPR